MRPWQKIWRILPLIAVLAVVLSGCGDPYLSALNPQGAVAQTQYDLMLFSFAIMAFVIVVVVAIFIYVLARFREKPGQTGYPKQVEGSLKLEMVWTIIPMILLIILAVPTAITVFSLAEDYSQGEDVINVKVTAYQYWWAFEYPELGIVTAQELVLPTDTRVHFELTSNDVIHSFWVPAIGGKMDTNPGKGNVNEMYLDMPTLPGTYKGKCAELCGEAHALMDFKVKVVEPNEYETWVAAMTNATDQVASDLAQQGRDIYAQNCIGCHAIAGEGGNQGPNLTGFADREKVAGILDLNEENLTAWLKDPQQVKRGTKLMPGYAHLSDEEMSALVEYLMGQKLHQ